ncbi:MAG: hypothetical protein WC988_00535 [Patescibacteria group bacterium]
MLKNSIKKITKLLTIVILFLGILLRLWNINFGLPHSWYADEPEIGEQAIKYTYEIKNILRNNDIYKLVPQSYVYGTFPVYFYTILTMIFSKTLGILRIEFTKMDLYVFMRVINALISFALIPVFYLLMKRLGLTGRSFISIAGISLVAFNWKLIVHAHYLNHDIIITLLILLANLFFYQYLQHRHTLKKPDDTINTALFALCFGLAVSTKITVLLTFPIYLVVFFIYKDFKNLVATLFIITGVFIVTNPFAWIFMGDFFGRLLEMRIKEGGMVFDSVNYSPFKYIEALSWILALPVLILSLPGIVKSLTVRDNGPVKGDGGIKDGGFYLVMALQVVFYVVFFSVQSRRVDRWMLPIIPNLMLFSLVALNYLLNVIKKPAFKLIAIVFIGGATLYYLYFPALLLRQFQRNTPKSASYIWAKENLPPLTTKFGITEEGLDPLNKLPTATIWQFNVYESEGAHLIYPPDPLLYDYIIISSRPMLWTKNSEIVNKYPYYASKWLRFEESLNDPRRFIRIKSFELSKPNLIPLSNVYIYRRIK